jgi:hypothetical protein
MASGNGRGDLERERLPLDTKLRDRYFLSRLARRVERESGYAMLSQE